MLSDAARWAECLPQFITAWLFCLNAPEQIPERLKMVVEWIGRT
jgi:hypothetical protein